MNEMPRCFGASGSVRASVNTAVPSMPRDVQIFWPLSTHSSPSRTARSFSPARSDPASGSL